mmetsp:Transcript_28898/g.48534  ORF Transcript_28898/g.48534 Transcript_28898/m.48534 type:complete len:582 (+) Transcript_28898:81-1826(+)
MMQRELPGGFRESDFREGLESENIATEIDAQEELKVTQVDSRSSSRICVRDDEIGADMPFHRSDFDVLTFMNDFILDSISVQFHLRTFMVQFVCHMLFPLAYCFIDYRAQGFAIGFDFLFRGPTYLNIVIPFLTWLMVVCYYLAPGEDRDVVVGGYLVPLMFYTQHRVIVALKYATLSETEYAKFQSNQDMDLASRYTAQMQLLAGYLGENPLILEFELGCAAARVGAKINEISVIIPSPDENDQAKREFAHWNAFLRSDSKIQLTKPHVKQLIQNPDGSFSLTVFDLCKAILQQSGIASHVSKTIAMAVMIFAIVTTAIPWIKFSLVRHRQWGRSRFLYIHMVSASIVTFIYGMVVFMLLYVGLWDIVRQYQIIKDLHRLIRITDISLAPCMSFGDSQEDKLRTREHIQENLEVILSASRPERRKNVAIRRALSKNSPANSAFGTPHGSRYGTPRYKDRLGGCLEELDASAEASAQDIQRRFSGFGNKSLKDGDQSHIPQLSFRRSQNILAWSYTRLVFQHFAERYRNRIDMYMGGTLMLMLFLMGVQLIIVITSADPASTFETVFFYKVLELLYLCGYF